MARQEVPKEDLVRDAKAFAVRVEFRRMPDDPDWIFVGMRSDGGGSVYFGEGEFYAFNPRGELRRAFLGERLYKAENRRLVAMRRSRSERATELTSRMLEHDEESQLLTDLHQRLVRLRKALDENSLPTIRSDVDEEGARGCAQGWLTLMTRQPIVVAERPNVV